MSTTPVPASALDTGLDAIDQALKLANQIQTENNSPEIIANKLAIENAALKAAIQKAWDAGDVVHLAAFVTQQ